VYRKQFYFALSLAFTLALAAFALRMAAAQAKPHPIHRKSATEAFRECYELFEYWAAQATEAQSEKAD
jgi:hypothetical protein